MNDDLDDPELAVALAVARDASQDEHSAPVHWWSLKPKDAAEEWPALFEWVELLRQRYPNTTRLPDCWWQHNDLVEALSALRDMEHACFGPKAPASGPTEWQRAFRDIEQRLEVWVRRLPCSVTGRGHESVRAPRSLPAGWDEFVGNDVGERRRRQGP